MSTNPTPPSATPTALDLDAIRADFIRQRGYWRPWTETLLQEHPRLVEAYARYAGHPAAHGPLSERQIELIYIALDTSGSHLFEPGLRTHMARALAVGVRPAEVFEVLHLVAAQGLDGVTQGAALLAALMAEPVAERSAEPLAEPCDETPGARADDALAALRHLDPAYAQAVQDFLQLPGPPGGLSPDDRGLIRVALAACFTAHHPGALRHHLQQGLQAGLTPAALLQAIQLGAHLAVHGTALGAQVYATLTHKKETQP